MNRSTHYMLDHLRTATIVALLSLLVAAFSAVPAFADDPTVGSPCALTDEQRATYAADGTLDERIASQESLDNDQPSPELIQQAIARQNAENGLGTLAVPDGWGSGMATSGKAHVIALHVSFPDYAFEAADTAAALQSIVGPTAEGEAAAPGAGPFPYESLSAYYNRASYRKLSITGETFEYQAQHERSYYGGNLAPLFMEALAELDKTENLTRFDANGDGRIDAVYLKFAGPNTGWGTTFWSNETTIGSSEAVYSKGKVRLWNAVTLAEPSNHPWAARTIIHETGHVLGLPDFYSYPEKSGASTNTEEGTDTSGAPIPETNRSGILTFDMMMDNAGDHNGFSKWMLDWLPEEKVTRIIANEQGVTVKQGQSVITQAKTSVDQALSAFTSDNAAETGGIIVVSNNDEGLFSSYYVLQYDRFAGNQSVQYQDSTGLHNLPSGFRLFRVRASLTSDGTFLAYSNTLGKVHNQLIELVDPDMTDPHLLTSDAVPSVTDKAGYGCMLYAGDSVSPKGYPSTNFFESPTAGFTGLTIAVTQSETDHGTVSVSYSDADKPVTPVDFTLTPTFESVSNVDNLVFETSSPVGPSPDVSLYPQMVIDGKHYQMVGTTVNDTQVTVPCRINPEDLTPSSSCEIIFPAGLFVLVQTATETVLSPEVRLQLKPNATMTPIEEAGVYVGTEHRESVSAISDVATCADGTRKFFQVDDGQLRLHTLQNDDATRVDTLVIEGVQMQPSSTIQSLVAVPLDTRAVFLATIDTEQASSTFYWIDTTDGRVLSTYTATGAQTNNPSYVAHESTVIVASTYFGTDVTGWRRGKLLTMLSPTAEGRIEERYGWTASDTVVATDYDALACARITSSDNQTSTVENVLLISAEQIQTKLAASKCGPYDAASSGDMCTRDDAFVVFPANIDRSLISACTTTDGYALLLSSAFTSSGDNPTNMLMRYDKQGAELARTELPLTGFGSSYRQIRSAEHGTLALMKQDQPAANYLIKNTVQFLDAQLQPLTSLITSSEVCGTWLADGRWVGIGHPIAQTSGKGSPEEAGATARTEGTPDDGTPRVYYNITTQLDKADEPVNPENSQPPVQPVDPADPQTPVKAKPLPEGDKTLVRTGDPNGVAATATLVCSLVALAALVAARMFHVKHSHSRHPEWRP